MMHHFLGVESQRDTSWTKRISTRGFRHCSRHQWLIPRHMLAILCRRICWTGVSMPCCGCVSMLAHAKSKNCASTQKSYWQTDMCNRWVLLRVTVGGVLVQVFVALR